MKKSIKTLVTGLIIIPIMMLGMLVLPTSLPVSAKVCEDGRTISDGAECGNESGVSCLFGEDCAFSNIVNAALYVIGAISVIMLIYGGIRYTTSGGNAASVTAAKNTILYAIVGIVVAVLAFAIVNFVLGQLIK